MEYKDVVKTLGILPRSTKDYAIDSTIMVKTVGVPFRARLKMAHDYLMNSKWRDCQKLSEVLLDITWEHLNTGHWKDVDHQWRYAYTYLSIFKAVSEAVLERKEEESGSKHLMKSEAILTCDMGLLMGAPVLNNLLTRLVSKLDAFIKERPQVRDDFPQTPEKDGDETNKHKKMKLYNKPDITEGNAIAVLSCPSLEYFQRNHFNRHIPVVLKDVIDYWPAMGKRKWSLDYLRSVAGRRTVPIEIGSRYTDDSWTQKLLTLSEFIETYIEGRTSEESYVDSNTKAPDQGIRHNETNIKPHPVGYLAQHQLFDQVPELQKDISIPTYCSIGEEEAVDINAWFGPEGTISPLHQDPKHNLLAQVVGYKYIRLIDEKYSENVYPHEGFLSNTSQVDVENPNFEKHPNFKSTPYMECILEPGQVLYIPPRCWHYVRSLSVSFSVSFWWE